MIDLEQLQTLAQLVDNIEIVSEKLEISYKEKDSSGFNKHKKEILDIQKKISDIIK